MLFPGRSDLPHDTRWPSASEDIKPQLSSTPADQAREGIIRVHCPQRHNDEPTIGTVWGEGLLDGGEALEEREGGSADPRGVHKGLVGEGAGVGSVKLDLVIIHRQG